MASPEEQFDVNYGESNQTMKEYASITIDLACSNRIVETN